MKIFDKFIIYYFSQPEKMSSPSLKSFYLPPEPRPPCKDCKGIIPPRMPPQDGSDRCWGCIEKAKAAKATTAAVVEDI